MLRANAPYGWILLLISVMGLPAAGWTAEIDRAEVLWTFEDGDLPGQPQGAVKIDDDGPRSPLYPDFPKSNRALEMKAPSWITIQDSAGDPKFDFDNGDAITLEAWVRPTQVLENMYIVGKGRTAASGARSLNQNWALRLRNQKGEACVNFLFRSRPDEESSGDWHRWTSKRGIQAGPRWHHVAVSYRFGEPESLRAFLDGELLDGGWDMGGETTRAPVVDDDEVWIGSTMGGNRGNSFHGSIDNIAIHRREVPTEELRTRFRWTPPEVVPPQIPPGKVVVELFAPLDSHTRFPEYTEPARLVWEQDAFGFAALPHAYDDWGVREDWGQTLLIRAWADIALDPGTTQFMTRARGLSRLMIDGKEVVRSRPQKGRGNAHNVVDPLPEVPVVGMRPHWMNDQERRVEFESDGRVHRFCFETIVGGPSFRAEFGESCVAVAAPDSMFHLLSGLNQIPLTDEGWAYFEQYQTDLIRQLDETRRRQANQIQGQYWAERHARSKARLISASSGRSIDALVRKRIERHNADLAADQPNQDVSYFEEKVQPILSQHCDRCHGRKQKGGFSLKDRTRVLAGGESGEPAVVPGEPEKSYLLELVSADHDDYRMPPTGPGLSPAEVAVLRKWIQAGATMSRDLRETIEVSPVADDFTFLRRVFVDTVGVPPTREEVRTFFADQSEDRRTRLIDRLLRDPRWADNWVGYWQDVLAENPNMLKPTLNNTGPFRWWIHEALRDNKPIDRFATELIQMRGSTWGGGSAGFSVATQNDVPMAAKAHVVASAFLGVNLKCARCHDAPYHQWKQETVFQLAAMLARKTIKLPESSTVPAAFFEQQSRKPLITATLRKGSEMEPEWPFDELGREVGDEELAAADDAREKLAVQITGSRRFAEVIANRLWKRLMGAGLVEPVDDWEDNPPVDPQLLAYLADELIRGDYDLKALARVILTSETYQRVARDERTRSLRLFEAPYRRRMSAEQIVDSAFHVSGQDMRTELLTLDVEGTYPSSKFLHFGRPSHAWEFTTLANERDRPSLALPRAQAVADVLKAFGWRNSRPEPLSEREETPNLIQPGSLANGTLGTWLTRLTDDSQLTALVCRANSVDDLVDDLFLTILTREPTESEKARYAALLKEGFEQRLVPVADRAPYPTPKRFRHVSWTNHLNSEANKIKLEMERLARKGDPPTNKLQPEWRERAEDVVWALLNSPEMILVP